MDELKCSFCKKLAKDVDFLLVENFESVAVGICDECVALCAEIVLEKRAEKLRVQDKGE